MLSYCTKIANSRVERDYAPSNRRKFADTKLPDDDLVAHTKRIPRAKKVLAGSKKLFDTQSKADFSARLPAVQRALYLLFNEGYHGASAEFVVRIELCQEAMRLMALLLEHPSGAIPSSYAIAALICLDKARLPARLDRSGNLTPLLNQDRALWDQQLVKEDLELLDLSAKGAELEDDCDEPEDDGSNRIAAPVSCLV